MKPDALVLLRFKTKEEGGRETSVSGDVYGCAFVVDDEAFDCRLLLGGARLELGGWYEIPIKFLNPDFVLEKLAKDKVFSIWEGKTIADGSVINVFPAS